MAERRDAVELTVAGQTFGGWTALDAHRGLDEAAGQFSLELTDRWPDSGERRVLREFTACALTLGGDPVLAGVIDKVSPRYDARTHSVSVTGRSLPGQLIDCSCELPTGELKGLSLAAVARRLAQPFGVEVVDLAKAAAPFARLQIEQGETVFEVLERLARQRGVFLTDDAMGRLVIRRRGTRLQGEIEGGVNVLSAEADFDGSEQHSHYRVKGQREGADDRDASSAARVAGRAADASVPIHRPKILLSETQGDDDAFKDRAGFEAALRRGRARTWTYRLAGWRRPDGALWETGEEVEVTDELMGLSGARLLVVKAAFLLDAGGEVAVLTLGQPEGYDLEAERPRVEREAQPTGWDSL